MRLKAALNRLKDELFQAHQSNMVGVTFAIERRPWKGDFDYCVSKYVCREKSAEYWPAYRGGVRYNARLEPYGEEFLATESQNGGHTL